GRWGGQRRGSLGRREGGSSAPQGPTPWGGGAAIRFTLLALQPIPPLALLALLRGRELGLWIDPDQRQLELGWRRRRRWLSKKSKSLSTKYKSNHPSALTLTEETGDEWAPDAGGAEHPSERKAGTKGCSCKREETLTGSLPRFNPYPGKMTFLHPANV